MLNGVGLTTPRGSGTNGYVQRSLANLPPIRIAKNHDQNGYITRPKMRVNPEIAMHEKLRSMEVRLMEMRIKKEGMVPPEELEKMIASERERLMKLLQQDSITVELRENESNRLAEQKMQQNEKMKRALKLTPRKPRPLNVEREDEDSSRLGDAYRDSKKDRGERRRSRSYSGSQSSSRERRYRRPHSRRKESVRRRSPSSSYDSSYTPSYSSRGSSRSYSRDHTRSYSSYDSDSSRYRRDSTYSRSRTPPKQRGNEGSHARSSSKSLEGKNDMPRKSDKHDNDRYKTRADMRVKRRKYRSRSTSSRSSSSHYRKRRYSRSRGRYSRRYSRHRDESIGSRSVSGSLRRSGRKKSAEAPENVKKHSVSSRGSDPSKVEHDATSTMHHERITLLDDGALSDSSMEHSDN
ncbi:hypothetical protein X943_001366 [Babesia divergens]|uniref:CWF21 domain-containing protein n=1 Tax=Babesia divergens TaxID=32595 RepID=A0AAD9LL74_BABDI|nr:hypothetical protein X943_001366 [Babesia divergens]